MRDLRVRDYYCTGQAADDQDDRMIDRTQPPLTRLATAGNLTGKPIVAYKVKPNVISTCTRTLDTWGKGKAGNSMRQSCS